MTPIMQNELEIIQKVANHIAPRYTFGYYDVEDIEQECFILALEAINKYDPKLGSLENFLYTCLHNGLKNFLRKNYYRKTFVCNYCNGEDPHCEYCHRRKWRFEIKKNLMEPIDIDGVNCNGESNISENQNLQEKMELDEVFTIINKHLEIPLRIDYLKMLEGLHVPKVKREIIEKRIVEILQEYGYDRE